MPIQDYYLKRLRTGITIDHLPGCIPVYYEVEACQKANYTYWDTWQALSVEQQTWVIAKYLLDNYVQSNQADAQNKEIDKERRKARKKAKKH